MYNIEAIIRVFLDKVFKNFEFDKRLQFERV